MKKAFRILLECVRGVQQEESPSAAREIASLPSVPIPQPAIPDIGRVIGDNWAVQKLIYSSEQSVVFSVSSSSEQNLAVKIGPKNDIDHEISIYNQLHKIDRDWGLARMRDHGVHQGYSYIVMDLLGPSLEQSLLSSQQQQWPSSLSLAVLGQLLYRLETFHNLGFIHGNIEPKNILLGRVGVEKETVYLIDFKHARQYKDERQELATFSKDVKDASFPIQFAPVSYHDGYLPSRADDLESVIYVYVYMCKGRLPWDTIRGSNRDTTIDHVRRAKVSIKSSDLLKGTQIGIAEMFDYIRSLSRFERPDYHRLRKLVKKAIKE